MDVLETITRDAGRAEAALPDGQMSIGTHRNQHCRFCGFHFSVASMKHDLLLKVKGRLLGIGVEISRVMCLNFG